MLFRSRYEKQLQRIKEQNKDGERVYDVEDVRNVLEKGRLPWFSCWRSAPWVSSLWLAEHNQKAIRQSCSG